MFSPRVVFVAVLTAVILSVGGGAAVAITQTGHQASNSVASGAARALSEAEAAAEEADKEFRAAKGRLSASNDALGQANSDLVQLSSACLVWKVSCVKYWNTEREITQLKADIVVRTSARDRAQKNYDAAAGVVEASAVARNAAQATAVRDAATANATLVVASSIAGLAWIVVVVVMVLRRSRRKGDGATMPSEEATNLDS